MPATTPIATGGTMQVFVTTGSGALSDTGVLRFSVSYPVG